jgi:hypothetical protein
MLNLLEQSVIVTINEYKWLYVLLKLRPYPSHRAVSVLRCLPGLHHSESQTNEIIALPPSH